MTNNKQFYACVCVYGKYNKMYKRRKIWLMLIKKIYVDIQSQSQFQCNFRLHTFTFSVFNRLYQKSYKSREKQTDRQNQQQCEIIKCIKKTTQELKQVTMHISIQCTQHTKRKQHEYYHHLR